jgi:hypothetical protein
MLSDYQLDVLMMLSASVWFGVIGGALAGALSGALIRSMRSHQFVSFLPGAVYSVLPSVSLAVAVNFFESLLIVAVCEHGEGKTNWHCPDWMREDWVLNVRLLSTFVAGVAGAFLAQRYQPRPLRPLAVVALSIAGAILGALAYVIDSFDGYFVLQSNAKPIAHAITGSLVGSLGVLVWCFAVSGLQAALRTTSA